MWTKIIAIVHCREYSTSPVRLIFCVYVVCIIELHAAFVYAYLLLFTPQRYYGKSLPFGKESFRLDNIGYLSVEHAMADFAVLVKEIRQTYKIDKVVSFGGR